MPSIKVDECSQNIDSTIFGSFATARHKTWPWGLVALKPQIKPAIRDFAAGRRWRARSRKYLHNGTRKNGPFAARTRRPAERRIRTTDAPAAGRNAERSKTPASFAGVGWADLRPTMRF